MRIVVYGGSIYGPLFFGKLSNQFRKESTIQTMGLSHGPGIIALPLCTKEGSMRGRIGQEQIRGAWSRL